MCGVPHGDYCSPLVSRGAVSTPSSVNLPVDRFLNAHVWIVRVPDMAISHRLIQKGPKHGPLESLGSLGRSIAL
jgi:hypothetical protein